MPQSGGLPEVDVLLATYNGESYLEEFLNSLVSQLFVRVHLIIGDDCSTDKTVEILNRYITKFESFKLINNNERLGPAGNFVNLMRYSKHQFISFADQDDLWLPYKLQIGVQQISDLNFPALFVSAVSIANSGITNPKIMPYPLNFLSNRNQGCTFLFNKELRRIFVEVDASKLIMHDWAMQIVAEYTGEIKIHKSELVWYRLHESNVTKMASPFKSLGILFSPKKTQRRLQAAYIQSKEVLRILEKHSTVNSCLSPVEDFVQYASCFESPKQNCFEKARFLGFMLRHLFNNPLFRK